VTPENPSTPECVGSQTVGPYYAIGLDHLVTETLAAFNVPGRHITLSGTLFDADGNPVPDAILELWQASATGIYNDASAPAPFTGFARLSTHDNGRFDVHTIEPGPVPFLDGRTQAPHLVVLLFMRGLMRHLVTRIYLPNQPLNASDPILQLVPESRRSTLIAQPAGDTDHLHWDIHLQGEQETVFFDC
jgi:protocatechuate 3,4-dioxygenase alpha subunit